jgi:DNA-directed RNA polymerase specialized sigma54-like protein
MPNSRHRGRYHRGTSTFGTGRRVKLDRNARARFKWFVRADCQHNRLSHAGEKIALALVDMLGETGQLDPSYATLGKLTRADVSTVGRCLNRLRELGRVTWERRLRRDAGTSWRCLRAACRRLRHAECG